MLESLAFAFGEKPGDAISYAAVRRCSGVATSYRLASTWAGKSITTLRLSCSSSPFQRCHIVVASTHHVHYLSHPRFYFCSTITASPGDCFVGRP